MASDVQSQAVPEPLEQAAISRTRLRVPDRKLVDRPRLLSRLENAADVRIAIIQAPAGYGKSSLMQLWADRKVDQGAGIVWLSLDNRDRDPMFIAQHLKRAFDESGILPQHSGDGGDPSYYGWQALIEGICDRFIDCGPDCWVFVDDVHNVAGSASVQGLVQLIESAPRELRFVLGTRGDPGLPLGRLRVQHDVAEFGVDDLRFDSEETHAYLASRDDMAIEAGKVDLLQQRADGWIVAIKLFSLAMALEPENRHILESLTGERRQLADFFLEDVLSRQPEELQEFLLRISLLDEFCAAQCDAVLGRTDSRQMIGRCEANGLFVQGIDHKRTWYRFHNLFAEFLRRRFHDCMPEEAAEIYRRGAEWLTANGNHISAFDCAMKANDHFLAGGILEDNCEHMFATGLQSTMQEMASRLPSHVIALHPRVMLSLAWRLVAQWRLTEARSLVAVAEKRVRELASVTSNHEQIEWLELSTNHREIMIAHAAYKLEELEGRSLEAVQASHNFGKESYLMGSFHNSLQFAQREQFKLSRIDQYDQAARELVQRTGARQGEIFIAAVTGPSLILMGETARAKALLQENLALAQRIAGRDAPLGAVVAPALAMLHYETNELEQAQALLTQYLPLMTSAGFVEQLAFGWITQARLHMARQDSEACIAVLEEAADFGSRFELDRLRIAANAEKLRVLLKLGRPDDAARFARSRGLVAPGSNGVSFGQTRFRVLDSYVALATCRLLAADNRFAEALGLARHWRSFVGASRAVLAAVEWDVLVAELLLQSGERLAAQRSLIQALRKAEPAGLIRRFLDEGEPVAGLLRQMTQALPERGETHGEFLTKIAGCLDPVGEQREEEADLEDERDAILGKVTSRELEILIMAGDGILNRQIGEQLGLTEGTVKWYLQQVYDKLGVRNRKHAFQRARRLGLIG